MTTKTEPLQDLMKYLELGDEENNKPSTTTISGSSNAANTTTTTTTTTTSSNNYDKPKYSVGSMSSYDKASLDDATVDEINAVLKHTEESFASASTNNISQNAAPSSQNISSSIQHNSNVNIHI